MCCQCVANVLLMTGELGRRALKIPHIVGLFCPWSASFLTLVYTGELGRRADATRHWTVVRERALRHHPRQPRASNCGPGAGERERARGCFHKKKTPHPRLGKALYMYVGMYAGRHTRRQTDTDTHTQRDRYRQLKGHTHTHSLSLSRTHSHTHTHTLSHTHTLTHTHTHTHTQVQYRRIVAKRTVINAMLRIIFLGTMLI
jgi:hypothetical protein